VEGYEGQELQLLLVGKETHDGLAGASADPGTVGRAGSSGRRGHCDEDDGPGNNEENRTPTHGTATSAHPSSAPLPSAGTGLDASGRGAFKTERQIEKPKGRRDDLISN
jgi:hypothetical protein